MPVITEVPLAVHEFIGYDPGNPLGLNEITQLAAFNFDRWSKLNPCISIDGEQTVTFNQVWEPLTRVVEEKVGQDGLDLLRTAVLFEATIITNNRLPSGLVGKGDIPTEEGIRSDRNRYEGCRAITATRLLYEMTQSDVSAKEAWNRTWNYVRLMGDDTAIEVGNALDGLFPKQDATAETFGLIAGKVLSPESVERKKCIAVAQEEFDQAKRERREHPDWSLLRILRGAVDRITQRYRDENLPNIFVDLTLGDIYGHPMPLILQEALALNPSGSKGRRVGAVAPVYEQLLYEAGDTVPDLRLDPHGYEGPAMGWPMLRKLFGEHARHLGLISKEKSIAESMIGIGSSGVFPYVYKIADTYFRERRNKDKPTLVVCPNPTFRAVPGYARNIGLQVEEFPTGVEFMYLPDDKTVEEVLREKSDNYNIVFVDIPVSNPSAEMQNPNKQRELDAVLAKYGAFKIIDGAYLGSGDNHDGETQELSQAISEYSGPIIYVLSSSKTAPPGPRPGLRLGWAATPDKDVAKYFRPVAQAMNLGFPYPLQTTALALFDAVGEEEGKMAADYFTQVQERFKQILKRADTIRRKTGLSPILADDENMPIFGHNGIYVYFPIPKRSDDEDALDTVINWILETGLVVTPYEAFYAKAPTDGAVYARATISKEVIPQIENLFPEALE